LLVAAASGQRGEGDQRRQAQGEGEGLHGSP
jgi:hypothetical protein